MNKVEQFIKDNTNQCSNMVVYLDSDIVCSYAPWLTPEQALRAVGIEREAQEEKLSKAIRLADAMYYAAQMITTDASHLRKATEDWWLFKNVELNNKE